ncbi:MAG: XdhC family protein [Gammaproteobacteria bacterium]|nr:XdhC family protein [Gammaproteobacteria bacterium]
MQTSSADFETSRQPLEAARDWMASGLRVALATVVETWGSAPRPVGSQIAVNERAEFAGSVSAGCIESFLVSEMLDIMDTGLPRKLSYGVSDAQAREVRLSCGGTIILFAEPLTDRHLVDTLSEVRPVARLVDLTNGHWLLSDGSGNLTPKSDFRKQLERGISTGQSRRMEMDERDFMLVVHALPQRLIVVGAVHIAEYLVPMARQLGFETAVVDPRPAFARNARLPGIGVDSRRVSEAMADLAPDRHTAVVTLGHDPLVDDPALVAALRSDACYIGCLGSRRTHACRLQRLHSQGFPEEALARLHGPVGLDLGGRSPGEIAVSILAEIVAARHGRVPVEGNERERTVAGESQ